MDGQTHFLRLMWALSVFLWNFLGNSCASRLGLALVLLLMTRPLDKCSPLDAGISAVWLPRHLREVDPYGSRLE